MAGVMWEPPGPGTWTTDRSHNDRPPTRFGLSAPSAAMREGMATGFAMTGVAFGPREGALLNGWPYARATWADPATYDDLEVAAKDFFANRRWEERIATWERERRPQRMAECRALQAIDVGGLDDGGLVDHLVDCIDAQQRGSYIHFEQHALCVLIGELVLSCREWGIAEAEVVPLLDGHSEASSRTAMMIRAIAGAVDRAGVRPSTLDDIRNADASAAAALDTYLDLHGNVPVAGFDFDARTLNEMPFVVVNSVLAALDQPPPRGHGARDAAVVRERVPAEHRSRFDDLLEASRAVYGIRDDDVHFSLWCRGLSRRALLEIGRRLVARGQLHEPDDVVALALDEVRALLVDARGEPTPAAIRARVAEREAQAQLAAPPVIGDRPSPPPYDEMPPAVRRMTEAMVTYTQLRRARSGDSPLAGTGVGTTTYRGRAVVAANADDAFDRVQPGDVLVTVLTTPAFNAVLPLCGGLVVEDAGILSHAAVTARELGIPAVVGVAGAMTAISDGATVELDPVAGVVRTP